MFKMGHPVLGGGIRWCMFPWYLSEWREFPSAPCLAVKKNLGDSSRLHVVEIARVA